MARSWVPAQAGHVRHAATGMPPDLTATAGAFPWLCRSSGCNLGRAKRMLGQTQFVFGMRSRTGRRQACIPDLSASAPTPQHPVTGELITDHRKIAMRYMRTWFIIDLLATFPVDYIVRGVEVSPVHCPTTHLGSGALYPV